MNNKWVFTFGSGHPNEGKYVVLEGTYSQARNKMNDLFGNKWGFQFKAEEWAEWLKLCEEIGYPTASEMEVAEGGRHEGDYHTR